MQDAIYDSSYRKLSATFAHSTLATILYSPNEDEILEDMQSYIALGIAFLETV
ncbi:hypothetical protein PSEUDO8O_170421 [Pseudomonas sp. 8O]|nr:hypothetical protein PSEUDO8O_170421 [Pseudomonas sp. 8O]